VAIIYSSELDIGQAINLTLQSMDGWFNIIVSGWASGFIELAALNKMNDAKFKIRTNPHKF
jgi:hypothetical protein